MSPGERFAADGTGQPPKSLNTSYKRGTQMIKSRMAQRGQGGFTLIELLVVVAILAILIGVAVVGVGAMRDNANKSACKADRDTVETAAMAWRISNPSATTTVASLAAGTSPYLKKVDTASFTLDWTDAENPVANYVNNQKYGARSATCD